MTLFLQAGIMAGVAGAGTALGSLKLKADFTLIFFDLSS
jgi:hypothetical protein